MGGKMTLGHMVPGERARVTRLSTKGGMRRRMLDMGLVPETVVECVGQSMMGDPKAYMIRGAVIAIRSEDAAEVTVSPLPAGTSSEMNKEASQ